MHRSQHRLMRRTFLKALGLGIAAPLAAQMSRLAVAAPGDRPKRLFIFYVPHGMPPEHLQPYGEGDAFLQGSNVLSPLLPYRDRVAVVRGLSMNGGISNHVAIRATLTGFAEGEGSDSIDRLIADGMGVTPHVLGAIPYDKGAGFYSDCYLVKHGSWVRPIESPVEAVTQLFQGVGPAPMPMPGVDENKFRAATLALTEGEIEAMQGVVSGLTREESKLALHLDAVRNLKAKASGEGPPPPMVSCDSKPALPAVDAVAGLDPLNQSFFGKLLDAHLEASAYAFMCGSARVITLQNMWVNAGLNFGFEGGPGIAKGHHDPVSHSWDAAGRAEFAQCQKWFFERLAEKFLKVLDQPDPLDVEDPTRTVLDNSLVYVCSEVSDGANHNSDHSDVWIDGQPVSSSLPAILIGGGGGYLKTQQVVQVERSHIDMLATLADAMDVPLGSIGGQSVSAIQELKA
ncbi:DUF1552 domain-containing protein [Nannocystis pusilla]|uniref:DUF1552 domain-containing protein n=1 Tax=Nannocystis pusilla TaxID=889268 RepID=UPI003BF4EBAD